MCVSISLYDSSDCANGTPTNDTVKYFMCVCHVELNWKNFTPVQSVPSITTGKIIKKLVTNLETFRFRPSTSHRSTV